MLSEQRISALFGGFTGSLDPLDEFGTPFTALGDLDGDGRLDMAVGVPGATGTPALSGAGTLVAGMS